MKDKRNTHFIKSINPDTSEVEWEDRDMIAGMMCMVKLFRLNNYSRNNLGNSVIGRLR